MIAHPRRMLYPPFIDQAAICRLVATNGLALGLLPGLRATILRMRTLTSIPHRRTVRSFQR